MVDGEGLTYKSPVRCGCGRKGCPRCRLEARLMCRLAEARVKRAASLEIQRTVDGILDRAGLNG